MPRIFGVNVIAAIIGGFAFFMLGWVWFGVVFQTPWMELHAFTPDQLAAGEANMVMSMFTGFLLALIASGFLSFLLNRIGVSSMGEAIQWSLVLCIGFVVLTQAYVPVYAMSPIKLFLIDASYQLVGFPMMAAIHVMLRNLGSKT